MEQTSHESLALQESDSADRRIRAGWFWHTLCCVSCANLFFPFSGLILIAWELLLHISQRYWVLSGVLREEGGSTLGLCGQRTRGGSLRRVHTASFWLLAAFSCSSNA